jgi:hypothetical protein
MIQIVRPKLLNNSNILSNLNTKVFLLGLQFSVILKDLFYRKNILATEIITNVNCNMLNLSIHLFFRKRKLIKFRVFSLKKKSENPLDTRTFLLLSNHLRKKFNTTLINLKLKILNKLIIFPSFFNTLKKKLNIYKRNLFDRRFSLYIDFLKLNGLYQISQINLNTYVFILGEIFQRLTKKKHGKFLNFIKTLFNFIIYNYKFNHFFNKILGIKFLISGKIKGKLRARATLIQIGAIPLNSQNKSIEFSQSHVYTTYGVYGMKLWINKEINKEENLLKSFSKGKYLIAKKNKQNLKFKLKKKI